MQTLTNDNATGLGTKLDNGFAPQGATPVTRRPTSRPLKITRPSLRPRPCFSHANAGPTRPVGKLDIFWLKDKSLTDLDDLPDPEDLAAQIIENLEAGLDSFRKVLAGMRPR